MAFPTIPTGAATRITSVNRADTTATRTSPALSAITKNAGDLLIVIVIGYQSNATANNVFSGWSGGFTEFADLSSTTNMCIGAAYKWSTGAETAAVTVTQAATITGHASIIIMSIPGAHATVAPEAGGYASVVGGNADPGSLTPSWGALDTLWIAVGGSGEDSLTGSYTGIAGTNPTNYSDIWETGMSADLVGAVEGAVAFRQLNAASENPGAFSCDTSNTRSAAITIAVRPMPAVVLEGTSDAVAEHVADLTVTGAPVVTFAGACDVVAEHVAELTVTTPSSVTRSIVAGPDDAKEAPAGVPEIVGSTILLDVVGFHMGLRFTDLPIQNGANILSAIPALTLIDSTKNDAEGTWYGHDVDDAPTFSTTDGDLDGRTKTTASVAWTTNDLGNAGDRVTAPDLTAIIQEIVDRPGWQPGNNIALLYVHNSATDKIEVAAYEHATALAPSLAITYEPIPIVNGVAQFHWTFTATAIGTLGGGAVAIAGASDAVAEHVGELGVAKTLVGASEAIAEHVAALTLAKALAGASDAVAEHVADLGIAGQVQFVGASEAIAEHVAVLGVARPVAGASEAVAEHLADATVARGLAGASEAVGQHVADVTIARGFVGASDAIAEHVAAVTVDRTLTGASDAVAEHVASLGVLGQVQFAGAVEAVAEHVAALRLAAALAGASEAVGEHVGLIAVTRPLAGVSHAVAEHVADLTVTGLIPAPGIPVAVQDPSHAVLVRDPLHVVLATDLPSALVITTNGQHSAAVSDAAKSVTVRDADHTLMVSTPD